MKRLIVLTALAVLGLASSASAAPVLNLDLHHNQTNFAPGGATPGEFWVDLYNVGNDPTVGPITFTLKLQSGLTRNSVRTAGFGWSCPGNPGDSTITCTTSRSIPRKAAVHFHNDAPFHSALDVLVDVNGFGFRTVTATVSGGGAGEAPVAAGCEAGVAACTSEGVLLSDTPAPFGILPESFLPGFFEADGVTPERQAGAHPDLLTVPFDLTSIDDPDPDNPFQKRPAESLRNIVVDLPPGFLGDPTAVGECSPAKFNVGECPRDSQVGRIFAHAYQFGIKLLDRAYTRIDQPVFNLSHPYGNVADLGFVLYANPVHVRVSLDPANGYAIRSTVSSINETAPPHDQKLVLWGIPADASHDYERCTVEGGFTNVYDSPTPCPTNSEPKPYLTVPSQCDSDNAFRIHHYDSWQNPGDFGPEIDYTLPARFTGCERPRFDPSVSATPTGTQANSPTGMDVTIHVPQNESADALAAPPVKSTVVSFPEGMTFNPAFADGLTGCSMSEFGISSDATPNGDPVACPDNSRIGEVSLNTPLLPKPVVGSMYLAKPLANPCGNSNFALYMAVHDTEQRGVLIKIPGCIELDSKTGQITTSFDDLPQFPFSDFTLSFRSGQRAPLVTPPACGTQTIGVEIASYARPDDPVDRSKSFAIDEGPGGGACPASLGSRPFDPKLAAGSLNPSAGAFSPFVVGLTRSDADQELARFEASPPPGVAAKLAGVPYCPEAALAAIPTALGTAKQEIANPSCPAASLIGHVSNGVGSGQSPNYFNGNVYLAGPYKGAPISGVAVVPGIAGPYDLGNVVVRAPAYFDPATAQVKVKSDEIPKIFHGVLLRVREVHIALDRNGFTTTPTSCAPSTIEALVNGAGADLFSSTDDSSAEVSDRYQVLGCGSLGFRPRLYLRLYGRKFTRSANPRLRAVLVPRKGDANVARSAVTMPHTLFLDQSHIRTICTRAQFAVDACPKGSVYGAAVAKTPLLDEPLRGPVYLRSSSNPLPDLVADLRGQVRVEVASRTDSVRGALRSTFDVVPDAPVSKFVLRLQGGQKSLLVASDDLCRHAQRARVNLRAHNGRRRIFRPKIRIPCGKRKGKRRGAGRASLSRARAVR